MRGFLTLPHIWPLLCAATLACGAADFTVDPGDLELRDLLGISPGVAADWDESHRAQAREVLTHALYRASEDPADLVPLGLGRDERSAILASMSALDHARREDGRDPVVVARVRVDGGQVELHPVPAAQVDMTAWADPSMLVLDGWDRAARAGWDDLALRQPGLMAALARQAGHGDRPAPLPVVPAPQEPFAAIFVDAGPASFLAVNPVLLAAQEPSAHEHDPLVPGWDERPAGAELEAAARVAALAQRPMSDPDRSAAAEPAMYALSSNPYSFYGSINECAAFQRQRCQACVQGAPCLPVTRDATDGLAECSALSAEEERGYYLLCINLALAIATAAECTTSGAPQCPQVTGAGNQLSALAFNSVFLDDAACATGLDACLTELFGAPEDVFPGPGEPDPGSMPRDVQISCGDPNVNCEFAPSCDASCATGSCESGGCGGCDSSGCGGCDSSGCGGCDGGGGGGGGCDSDNSGGCDSSGCGSCDSSGCDSSGCDSSGCDNSCDGGSCDGGCDGGGCDGGGCQSSNSSCGSGGNCNSSCNVSRRQQGGHTALALLWAALPLAFLECRRRRAPRRRREEPGSAEPAESER